MTILERGQQKAYGGGSRLDTVFEDHVEAVYAYACRRTRSATVAEDIAAEVFSEAAAKPHKIPGRDALPWLFGIARRKVADHFRRCAKGELSLSDDLLDGTGSPLGQLIDDETSERLRTLVDSLLPDQREAILLHYVEGLTAKQIAIVMRRSTFAVNSLLQRARRRLQEEGRDYFQPTDRH